MAPYADASRRVRGKRLELRPRASTAGRTKRLRPSQTAVATPSLARRYSTHTAHAPASRCGSGAAAPGSLRRSVCFDAVGERRCGATNTVDERWGDDTARPLGGGCCERDLRPPGTPHTPVRPSSGELGEDRSGTDRNHAGVGALGPAHGELYPFRLGARAREARSMDDSCRDAPALMTSSLRSRSPRMRVVTAVDVTACVHECAAVRPVPFQWRPCSGVAWPRRSRRWPPTTMRAWSSLVHVAGPPCARQSLAA